MTAEEQRTLLIQTRQHFAAFKAMLEDKIPNGADKTYLIRKFREVGMWADRAIMSAQIETPEIGT